MPKNDTPAKLRRDLMAHFRALGLTHLRKLDDRGRPGLATFDKGSIRSAHAPGRKEALEQAGALLRGCHGPRILEQFAGGTEVDPWRISPELVPVASGTLEAKIFRVATSTWSIPVSAGFGRRMRYLIRDSHNGKLIGILALGDPVFNLRARDTWIGWNQQDRRDRLVHVLDGYVLGAMPPYNDLLCGKLIVSLIASQEVQADFQARYGESTGLIGRKAKSATLDLVTITSALGRSSLYNRLHLRGSQGQTLARLQSLGMTEGYGHFHLSEELFGRMRLMLLKAEHPIAMKHQYGDGPNWRIRMIRVALQHLGMSPHLVRHGISREVLALPLTPNLQTVLRDGESPQAHTRAGALEIGQAARERWIIPRAQRRPEYRSVLKENYLAEQLRAKERAPS